MSTGDCFAITIPTPPSKDLLDRCFAALARWAVTIKSIAVMWDETRPGWQQLTIATQPCEDDAAFALARELSNGEPPKVVRQSCRGASQAHEDWSTPATPVPFQAAQFRVS